MGLLQSAAARSLHTEPTEHGGTNPSAFRMIYAKFMHTTHNAMYPLMQLKNITH